MSLWWGGHPPCFWCLSSQIQMPAFICLFFVGTSLLQEIVYLVSQGADPDEIGLMNIDEQLPVLEYPQPGLDIIQVMQLSSGQHSSPSGSHLRRACQITGLYIDSQTACWNVWDGDCLLISLRPQRLNCILFFKSCCYSIFRLSWCRNREGLFSITGENSPKMAGLVLLK